MIESKPDNKVEDLRLHKPWPELQRSVLFVSGLLAHAYTGSITPVLSITSKWCKQQNLVMFYGVARASPAILCMGLHMMPKDVFYLLTHSLDCIMIVC